MNCEKTLKCIEFVLGASKVGIDIIDSRFNIRYIDPAWKKLYGDPAGKKCYQYFMDRKSVCPHCGIVEALRTKKIAVSEEVMIKEGDKPVRVTTVPFQDEDGEWIVAETNVDISDMKRTEDALRASQEEFEAIAERSVVGIVMAQGSRVTYANESFARIFGYKAKELIGAEVMSLVARSDREMFAAKIQNRLRGAKGISQYEMSGIRKGGAKVAVEVGAGPVVAVNGVPTLIITVQDISERKRMERDLRSSEKRYRQLFEENYDAIFVAEPKKGVLVDCNKKAEELIGFSRKKILSMRVAQLHPKPIREKVLSVFNKMARGMKMTVEVDILTKDRRRVPVSISGMSLQIDGKLRVVGIFKDISESRRSAEALRQSEELYRMLSELAQEAIYILDLRGRFTYMNTYAARFVGKKPADVVGRSMTELFDNRMGLIEKKRRPKDRKDGKVFFCNGQDRELLDGYAPFADQRCERKYNRNYGSIARYYVI